LRLFSLILTKKSLERRALLFNISFVPISMVKIVLCPFSYKVQIHIDLLLLTLFPTKVFLYPLVSNLFHIRGYILILKMTANLLYKSVIYSCLSEEVLQDIRLKVWLIFLKEVKVYKIKIMNCSHKHCQTWLLTQYGLAHII